LKLKSEGEKKTLKSIVSQKDAKIAELQKQLDLVSASSEDAEAVNRQGLTLVHFSAQHQRFLWDRGCIQG
jgi:sulfate adenylyltransferase subunit 1 (EFTu-like GTPase family)